MTVTKGSIRPLAYGISKPYAGTCALEYESNGNTCIYVEVFEPGADHVAAILTPLTAPTAPAPNDPIPPAGYTLLPSIGAPGAFFFGGPVEIPMGHACATSEPTTNNLMVTTYKHEGGLWNQNPTQRSFKGVCATMTVTVPGQACPWFAFADDSPDGPEGEIINDHRPARMPIPDHAASVRITAAGDWWHAVGANSGPDGYGNPQPMVNPGYRSATYHAENITPPPADPKVNTLVGLLQRNLGNTSEIFPIGSGPHEIAALDAGDYKAIFFGMWDGRQWNNGISNGGSVEVTVTWTPMP